MVDLFCLGPNGSIYDSLTKSDGLFHFTSFTNYKTSVTSKTVFLFSKHTVVTLTYQTWCLTFESWSTFTPVVIYLIYTCAIILTGLGGTLVDVQVTVKSLKSRYTETLVGINSVFTDGSILTRLGLAFINVLLTVPPLVPSSTLATVTSVRDVHTGATVLTYFL